MELRSSTYDVVIIGGGIAGLGAALVLGRARRRVAAVDAGSPRNRRAHHAHGYLTRDGTPPSELLRLARTEVAGYGVELIDGTAVSAARGRVELQDGTVLAARHIVLAMGLGDILPDIPGAGELWGESLLQCPYCHGWEVRDRALGVLGTAGSSVQQALLVRQWSSDVTFFAHELGPLEDADAARLAGRGIRVVNGTVGRLATGAAGALAAVELADGSAVACEALFCEPLASTDPRIAGGLGCELAADGCVATDPAGRTSVNRVWAVGNVTDPAAQLISAAGDAYRVAVALNAELVEEDTAAELAEAHVQQAHCSSL
jgi:thioredoxin reductase